MQSELSLIELYDPYQYKEIQSLIDSFLVTDSTDDYYIRSGTSFLAFGLTILYADESQQIPYYVEHIVHENAHHALNVLYAIDGICLNEVDEEFEAPLREDKRPMIGVVHAFFVLTRILRTLCLIPFEDKYNSDVSNRIKITRQRIIDTKKIVDRHSRFTSLGHEFYSNLEAEIIRLTR